MFWMKIILRTKNQLNNYRVYFVNIAAEKEINRGMF